MTTAVQGFKDALGFLAKMTKMIFVKDDKYIADNL